MPKNEQLAEGSHKPIIRKFIKRKVYSVFKDNIWSADLADIQLINKLNEGFRFLLYVIDIFSKYAWVVPVKDKKGVSIVNAFQSILKKSNRKSNKVWVNKVGEFYNNSFKKWLLLKKLKIQFHGHMLLMTLIVKKLLEHFMK